nr:hypothetical protein [Tanacetum cinerariifolium]
SEMFHQIIDFLNGSSLRYALTEHPVVYESLIRQFWTTVSTRNLPNEQVELVATIDDEPAEELSSLRRSTRKKSIAKKRTTPPFSSIPFSTDDPDAAHRVHITFASDDSDDDDTPHPIITGVHLLGWEILHMVDRQTLIRLYGFLDALSKKQLLDGIALSLCGDLRIMLDTLEVDFSSPVWKDQHKWRVRSWKLYNFPGIHVLELEDGTVLYMLVDREYPLEIGVMEQLLDHKLQIKKDPAGDNTDKHGSSSPSMFTSQGEDCWNPWFLLIEYFVPAEDLHSC